jgi:hypothetical protein
MGAREPIADLVFGIETRKQNEAIDVLPFVPELRLQGQLPASFFTSLCSFEPARTKTHREGSCHRLVALAPSPSGQRETGPPQAKNATIVLEFDR